MTEDILSVNTVTCPRCSTETRDVGDRVRCQECGFIIVEESPDEAPRGYY